MLVLEVRFEFTEFDSTVLDDSIFNSPRDLTTLKKIERAIYQSLDEKGLVSKCVKGKKYFRSRGKNYAILY